MPLSAVKKTPSDQVPANRFDPETASAQTVELGVKPLSTAVQVEPLSVERKTPSSNVPAKIFVPETARELTI